MKTKIPLLHDHHTHPLLYATFRQSVDLLDAMDLEVASNKIAENYDGESLVLAFGWQDQRFRIDEGDLDKLPPCVIFNISLHAIRLNRAASQFLTAAGFDVEQLKDQDWYERNLRQVLNWFALLKGNADSLAQYYEFLKTLGVYSAEELLLSDGREIEYFEEAGLLDRTKFWVDPREFERLPAWQRDLISGFKLFADGAIGSRTTANSEAYLGEPDNFGMLIFRNDELYELISGCSAHRKNIAIHAIGDRAIEQVLGVFENCSFRDSFPTIRMEHAQLISVEQAKRAKSLGITLSMQPNFNGDSQSYRDRLPKSLVEANNPFRTLIDHVGFVPGDDLIFGSDGMPHGAQYAVDQCLSPPLESQRLSLDELVSGYCLRTEPEYEVEVAE